MVVRKAVLAGSWYSSSREHLEKEIKECFLNEKFGPGKLPTTTKASERKVVGAVSPHAGYRFSGPCAANSFYSLFNGKIPDIVVVIGFYHRGLGPNAVLKKGMWETPLGNLHVDENFTEELLKTSEIIKPNDKVFIDSDENSIELQMPFIKFCSQDSDTKIVPIKIISHEIKILGAISLDIANTIKKINKDIVIVSSSDMSHYNIYNEEQLKIMKEIDKKEINQFIHIKGEEFLNPKDYIDKSMYQAFAMGGGPTVCGRHTIATLMFTCKNLGLTKSECLKYYTSKDIEFSANPWTVGYFSGIISKS
ncbi:MAG: AmmeMemoRadiSam system protein B [Candidatus Lokiarchaeota archaeon]|nr:AmmeMemoRadiSam system protein B [Candidatus Lokiarchaeota archaeon]